MGDATPSLWQRLTEPAGAIQDSGRRRQARLLAGLLLAVIILGSLSGIIQVLTVPGFFDTFRFIAGGVVVLTIAYGLARSRHYLWAAALAVLVPLAVVLNVAVVNPQDSIAFAFLIVGILLGSILLPWRGLLLLAGVYLLALIALPLLTPVAFEIVVGPLFFVAISSSLVLLAYYHRNLVEGDRQQALAEANRRLLLEIGERQQTEDERRRLLRETQDLARQQAHILAAVQEGIVLLDQAGQVLLANPTGHAYLALLTETGTDTLVELAGRPLDELLIRQGTRPLRHELELDDPPRLFELWPTPMPAGPQVGGWVLILRDITESQSQQAYQQAQERLATVGQLAAGISHDLNNIMAVVAIYSQLLLKQADLDPGSRERIAIIQEQASRAAGLINQILDFSRRSIMERVDINILILVKELLHLMERTLPENIEIGLRYEQEGYFTHADPTRLQHVLMNLILNSRDAMPEGGRLEIRLDRYQQPDEDPPPLPDLPPGDWLRLTLHDDGTGIDAATLPHVFEPFFTTKGVGEGTGLGLSQAYGIIKQHDGFIGIDSQAGEGTTVTIFLPPVAAVAPALQRDTTGLPGAGERILVVEDEAATRAAVHDVLVDLGYEVLVAADGAAALALLSEPAAAIDLVLSDVIMPRMGGEELLAQMRRAGDETPVVFMTGYPLKDSGKDLMEQGLVAWLAKPFSADDVAAVVHQALHSD